MIFDSFVNVKEKFPAILSISFMAQYDCEKMKYRYIYDLCITLRALISDYYDLDSEHFTISFYFSVLPHYPLDRFYLLYRVHKFF